MAWPLAPLDLRLSIRHGARGRRRSDISFLSVWFITANRPIPLDDFGAMYKCYLLSRGFRNINILLAPFAFVEPNLLGTSRFIKAPRVAVEGCRPEVLAWMLDAVARGGVGQVYK